MNVKIPKNIMRVDESEFEDQLILGAMSYSEQHGSSIHRMKALSIMETLVDSVSIRLQIRIHKIEMFPHETK